MAVEKSREELTEISDELLRALPFGVGALTPELEQRFAEIAGPLSEEDWKRLRAVFVLRYMPQYAKKLMAA